MRKGTAVNSDLLRSYEKNLTVLSNVSATAPITVALKECQRDVALMNVANSEIAHANDQSDRAFIEQFVLVGIACISIGYVIDKLVPRKKDELKKADRADAS